MSEKVISEREAVLRERKAFIDGADCQSCALHAGNDRWRASVAAPRRYALPKVTRPRVVPDPAGSTKAFRVVKRLAKRNAQ